MAQSRSEPLSPLPAGGSRQRAEIHTASQQQSEQKLQFNIRCFHHSSEISPDWPVASPDAPAKLYSTASPNYHIFQTKTFLQIWERSYAPALNAQLCLIEVRLETGAPVLFLPLALLRRNAINLLSFTDQGVADYNAPVLFECGIDWTKAQAEALWQQIMHVLPAIDYVEFDNMPEMLGNLRNPLWLLATGDNQADSHATTLAADWSQIEQYLIRPKNIRRNIRLLKAQGSLEFAIAQTPEQRQAALDFMLHEKQQRFIETEVPGFETHPEKLHYFQLATESFHHTGVLHLSTLTLDDEIIACMWGLTSGSHYYGIMIASNLKNWAKYSPGRIMHYLLLEHLKQQRYDCLDLGVGNEEWKLQNCDLTIALKQIHLPVSWRGRLYQARRQLMTQLRSTALYTMLRPLKWRLIRAFKR